MHHLDLQANGWACKASWCTTRASPRWSVRDSVTAMIVRLNRKNWDGSTGAEPGLPNAVDVGTDVADELEAGRVILLPDLAFAVQPPELIHFSPDIAVA